MNEKVLGETWYETILVLGIFMWILVMNNIILIYTVEGVWDINRINYCLN